MGKQDEALKQQRLTFYKGDIDKIDKVILEFLNLSGARCAMLIDKDGHLVTKQGSTAGYDSDTVSALVAGSFAATKQMAKLLGEEEFSIMFHQGKEDSIQLSLVGDRTILAIIFDDKTTVGMVRLYAVQVADKLAQLFREMGNRKETAQQEEITKNFGDTAKKNLDDIFGS